MGYSAFHPEMKSKNIVERNLVHQYADVNWRMNHSAAIEKISLTVNDETDTVTSECASRNFHPHSETLRNISLYETRPASRPARLLKQITEVQEARKEREEKEMTEAVLLDEMEQEAYEEAQEAAVEVPGQPIGEPADQPAAEPFTYTPSEDGFVFSIAQIKFHIRLRGRLLVARNWQRARPAVA